MKYLETWFRYLWREIHHGNFIPLLVTVLVAWWVILPTYMWIKDKLTQNELVDEYVLTNQFELEQRIKALEGKASQQLEQRKGGQIGTTYH